MEKKYGREEILFQKIKNIEDMLKKIEEKIKDYLEKIKKCEYLHVGEQCPKCNNMIGEFKLHEYKKRKIRIVEDALVKIEIIILVRWKCPACRGTFLMYPDFVLPHKRYATEHIIELSEKYLEKDRLSYKNAGRDGASRIGYAKNDREKKCNDSLLAESTIKRWVGWLGSLKKLLGRGLDMIKQKVPNTKIFRQISPCWPGKYKGNEQRKLLENAMMLLKVRKEYEKIFPEKFFPRFAIKLE